MKREEAIRLRSIVEQAVTSLDDKTASTAVTLSRGMHYDGKMIPAKTRINWHGTLKRAAVDIWDTEQNNPDNAPTLWDDLLYRDGFRIIPEVITVTLAFAAGETGWYGDTLYRSKKDTNVYNPSVRPEDWERMV
jgi:hypothetical protein